MEKTRRPYPFRLGDDVFFTSHHLAKTWYRSHKTRIWHHPEFCPFADQNYEAMYSDLTISQIVIDEPEIDILLNQISESLFEWLKRTKRRYPGWSNKTRKQGHKIYSTEKAAKEIPGHYSFEEIDELMRLKLDDLHPQEVNYESIPFGFDQRETGIYSTENGKRFYLGVQDWLVDCRARLTFLTTETLISEVVTGAYSKLRTRNPIVLDLDAPSNLFPVKVPLLIERLQLQKSLASLMRFSGQMPIRSLLPMGVIVLIPES